MSRTYEYRPLAKLPAFTGQYREWMNVSIFGREWRETLESHGALLDSKTSVVKTKFELKKQMSKLKNECQTWKTNVE